MDQGRHASTYLACTGGSRTHLKRGVLLQIRSLFNLTNSLEFDAAIYKMSRLPDAGLPGYMRMGKRFGESGEVSLAGQNLLRPNPLEFVDRAGIISSEAQRSVYAKLTWRF